MIKKLFTNIANQRRIDNQNRLEQNLLRHEARVGGTVFGPVGKNQRRQFFCLDEDTWVWHEEWTDAKGEDHVVTTRYEVRPSGILKSQNGSHYQRVEPQEALRLYQAAQIYYDKIRSEVYSYA